MAVPVPAVDAVAQPRVGWRFVLPYVVATVAMWMSFNAPGQVLIGQQLIALDEADKERNLAIVLGVGAAISLVANPIFGTLSDRSRSTRGRRRPFLLGGAIGACVGLAVLAVAPSVAVLLIGWCLVQGSLNCYQAAITAIIPDRVPASHAPRSAGWPVCRRSSAPWSGSASPTPCRRPWPSTRCWAPCSASPCWLST